MIGNTGKNGSQTELSQRLGTDAVDYLFAATEIT
jgi:hypothetical protein